MIQILTDPDGFYSRAKRDATLSGPLAVMGLLGALRLLREVVVQFAGGSTDWIALFGSALFVVVFGFVWVLVGVVLHVVTGVFDPDGGSLVLTLKLVGYGFLPAAVGYALEALAAVAVAGNTASPLFVVFDSAALDVVFLVWAAFVWTFALKHSRELTLRQAAASVALGVGALVGLLVSGLLLLAGAVA